MTTDPSVKRETKWCQTGRKRGGRKMAKPGPRTATNQKTPPTTQKKKTKATQPHTRPPPKKPKNPHQTKKQPKPQQRFQQNHANNRSRLCHLKGTELDGLVRKRSPRITCQTGKEARNEAQGGKAQMTSIYWKCGKGGGPEGKTRREICFLRKQKQPALYQGINRNARQRLSNRNTGPRP